MRKSIFAGGGLAAAAAIALGISGAHAGTADDPGQAPTATPIKHVVVLYDENISFDHYFGTYPNVAHPDGDAATGDQPFHAKPGTPTVNGLTGPLLTNNPNATNPKRLSHAQAATCSQNHGYGAEQKAFDGGLMDKFVENTQSNNCKTDQGTDEAGQGFVMNYFDGNTVTGLWNLAQNYAMSDNSFGTNFGPSTVGAINLVSGDTGGVKTGLTATGVESGSIIGDPGPAHSLDDCTYTPDPNVTLSGKNVGDLLNAKGLSWGFFQGGFRPTSTDANGTAACEASHASVQQDPKRDYIPHHEPFQYYASTANPHHTPPASPAEIGHAGQANHQYDLTDFDTALQNHALPAVTFLKAAGFEDGHPGYSDPLDEQRFVARSLNALENSPEWDSTAVIIAYDDSDGWYDHVASPLVNASASTSDALSGTGKCGTVKNALAENARCGYGPRQPLLVVSPYAKQNYVDHTLTDQSSILKFIEDNWGLGRIGGNSMDARAGSLANMFDFSGTTRAPKVFLDPDTGQVTKTVAAPGGESTTPVTTVTTPGATVTTPATTVAAPAPKPAATPKVKASCTVKHRGRKVTVSCRTTGGTAKTRASIRVRLVRGGRTVATKAATVRSRRATMTFTAKKAWPKGRYTLRSTVTQIGGITSASKAVTFH